MLYSLEITAQGHKTERMLIERRKIERKREISHYRVFPSNWLLKNRLYSEIEQLRNTTKIDLCTVFTPVLCSKTECCLNILFWPQFYHRFFACNKETKIWLVFQKCHFLYFTEICFFNSPKLQYSLKKIYCFVTMILINSNKKNLSFKKIFFKMLFFSLILSKNSKQV